METRQGVVTNRSCRISSWDFAQKVGADDGWLWLIVLCLFLLHWLFLVVSLPSFFYWEAAYRAPNTTLCHGAQSAPKSSFSITANGSHFYLKQKTPRKALVGQPNDIFLPHFWGVHQQKNLLPCLCRIVLQQHLLVSSSENSWRDFLGGPVVKTPWCQCRGPGFDPGQGTGSHMQQRRSHMPQWRSCMLQLRPGTAK